MRKGENLEPVKLGPSQHFIKPLARYSEASPIKELEKCDIGCPPTYAVIIPIIQERGYVTTHNRCFYAERTGDIVTGRLDESFANLVDCSFVAGTEGHLDNVAQGERNWEHLFDEPYGDLEKRLEMVEVNGKRVCANQPTLTDIPCRERGRPTMTCTVSTDVFLGYLGYSLSPKGRCKVTVNLIPGDEVVADDEDESESRALRGEHRCPIYSTAMDAYSLNERHKLCIYGNNPGYPGYGIRESQYRIEGYEGLGLECDEYGSEM